MAIEEGKKAPAFTLKDGKGKTHKLAEFARGFFGSRVKLGSILWVARFLKGIGERKLKTDLETAGRRFFEGLATYRRSPAYKTRLKATNPVSSSELTDLLGMAERAYAEAAATAKEEEENKDHAKLSKASERCGLLVDHIYDAMQLEDANFVYFINEDY